MSGGPWFYKNVILVLGEYDGLGSVTATPLRTQELWVTMKGLPPLLQNPVSLSMVGSAVGRVLTFDQLALQREVEQRIRLVLDTRRRVRTARQLSFSAMMEVDLIFEFERLKGFCHDCGLLEHALGDCDKLLLQESV